MKLKVSAPMDGQRIDGVMYSTVSGVVVGQMWPYPTMSPSPQFQQSNDAIINLSTTFDGQDAATKTAWHVFSETYPNMMLCRLWEEEGGYYYK